MLKLSNISKSFFGVEVLHDISLVFEPGCVTSVVGENGAGKSTLMKIIGGIYNDYDGEISFGGQPLVFRNPRDADKWGISIIHQELNCISDLTAAENIFLGREPVNNLRFIDFDALNRNARTLLEQFDFPYPPNVKMRSISIGWQQIVEIVRALSTDARVIILDEPTSALTRNETDILFDKIRLLKEKRKIIIFVSHRLEEIYEIADQIAILRDGKLIGKYASQEIPRSALINKMVGKNVSEEAIGRQPNNNGTMLRVSGLTVFKEHERRLTGIDFELRKGEVLGIAGLMDSGKSELLKFLFGSVNAAHDGQILLRNKVFRPKSPTDSINEGVFYLPGDRKAEAILHGLDLIQNTSISVLSQFSRFGFLNGKMESDVVGAQAHSMNVRMRSLHQPIESLSGGNQQKIIFARGLLSKSELFLLDEPTRGIDVGAKEEIYKLIQRLAGEGISFMISSSDIMELLRIADRILVLFRGKPTALLDTNKANASDILHYVFNENAAHE
ncbi:MAG TPA: sugar ABC transporter ATP-binding protein [Candidatus Kryptonia bacterium]